MYETDERLEGSIVDTGFLELVNVAAHLPPSIGSFARCIKATHALVLQDVVLRVRQLEGLPQRDVGGEASGC